MLRCTKRWLTAGISGAALAACASSPAVDPALDQKMLARNKTAVGVMQMGIPGQGCSVTTIHLAKRSGTAFEVAETLRFLPVPGSAGDAAQFELPPAEYHIVGWTCDRSVGRNVRMIRLGKEDGGRFTESYGSFSLAAAEIVNLGYVRLMPTPERGMRLEVTDLDAHQHDKLRKDRPQIAAQMVQRFIKLSGVPLASTTIRR